MAVALTALTALTASTHAQSEDLTPEQIEALDEAWQAQERGDYATAINVWRPLADAGNGYAQLNLGLAYARGQGVMQDYPTAVGWFRRAAEQGVILAQINLGRAYENGFGVVQDYQLAYVWFAIADVVNERDNGGYEEAKGNRAVVERYLSFDEVATALILAQQCLDSGYKNCP